MPAFALANPGLVAIYQDFADEVFVLAVLGKNRILHTAEFAQRGRERENLETSKWVSWDVSVPEGALLFGATSAVSAGMSHQFWVGWLLGRRLHMQALMQLKPIEMEIEADEVPILPAVTDHSGVGNLYTWRPAGRGTALWRHSFSGQIKTTGFATSEALYEIPGQPVVSIAGTIPGEESQHAVIGWVEATAEGAVLGVALVSPERMRVIRSEPIAGMVPIVRQRLGVWAGVPMSTGRFQLIAVLQSLADKPAYSVAALNIGPNADQSSVALSAIDLPAGTLHSAAFDINKDYYYYVQPSFSPTFLTKDGDSLGAQAAGGGAALCRPGQPASRGVDISRHLLGHARRRWHHDLRVGSAMTTTVYSLLAAALAFTVAGPSASAADKTELDAKKEKKARLECGRGIFARGCGCWRSCGWTPRPHPHL